MSVILNCAGQPEFDSRQEQGFVFFSTAYLQALGPTQLPIQWAPAALSLGAKRQGHL